MTDLKNADEFFDEDLLSIGVNFTDETAPNTTERKSCGGANPKQKVPVPDAEYEPVPDHAPAFYDRLNQCTKWALLFGGLVSLIGYWEFTGQMVASAAVPSMVVCAAVGGFMIGNACRK